MKSIPALLRDHRIIVCAGAGGVGKTTVSAALALAAARLGRRVLVLTIDPSRRLAETLGIATNLADPVRLSPAALVHVKIPETTPVYGWVLDPTRVAERAVDRFSRSPEEARRLKANPIYQGVAGMVAGMQEYTAVEALHELTRDPRFDLVILDTPPSRNALSFLDAPIRLGKFLDGRVFYLFLPSPDGLLRNAARKLASLVLTTALGSESYRDLTSFLGSFAVIFKTLGGNAHQVRERLQQPDATFLMVTSSAQNAVYDALHFRKRLDRLGLACGGFVLNRTQLPDAECPLPDADGLPIDTAPALRAAVLQLAELARDEQALADREQEILATLTEAAGDQGLALAIPEISGGIEDISGLARLLDRL